MSMIILPFLAVGVNVFRDFIKGKRFYLYYRKSVLWILRNKKARLFDGHGCSGC